MKHLFLLFAALLLSGSVSFATIGAINGTASICAGTSTTLTDAATGGTWSSSNTGVATVGSSTGTVSGSTAGTTVISYTLGAGAVTQVVTINAAPFPITGVNTVCVSNTIFLNDAAAAGTWSSGNTAIAIIDVSGNVIGASAGTVLMSYTIGDGCSSEYEITVYPLPSVITGTTTICVGSTSPLDDSTTGGTWSSSTLNATINPVTGFLTGVTAGTSVITYTSNMLCITTTVATIHPAGPHIALHALPGDTLCAGLPDTLFATITGCTTINSRQWFRDNTYIGSGDTFVYIPDYGDSMSFHLNAISACTGDTVSLSSDTIRIVVNPTPGLTITGRDSICMGTTDTLIAHTLNPATLVWAPASGIGCITCDTVFCNALSSQTYTLTAACTGGCSQADTFKVTINTLPIISVSPDPVFMCLDSILLLTASGAATYSWRPSAGLSCYSCATPTLTGISNTVYYASGTTAFGCTDSVVVAVSVDTNCTTAVPVITSNEPLSIFPNPAHDQLTIRFAGNAITRITVTNLLGQAIATQHYATNHDKENIDISALPSGIYFIKVNNARVRKFVKD